MKLISVGVFLVLFLPAIVLSEAPITSQKPQGEVLTPKAYISLYSEKYGANEAELLRVAKCESNLRPNVKGDGGSAFGVMQFHKPTFQTFSELLGEKLDYYSYHDQIKLAAFIFAKYPNLRNHWTCY